MSEGVVSTHGSPDPHVVAWEPGGLVQDGLQEPGVQIPTASTPNRQGLPENLCNNPRPRENDFAQRDPHLPSSRQVTHQGVPIGNLRRSRARANHTCDSTFPETRITYRHTCECHMIRCRGRILSGAQSTAIEAEPSRQHQPNTQGTILLRQYALLK